MSFKLVFTESYNKLALRWLKKHNHLKTQYVKTLKLLEANPHHPSLRLHALKGKLTGLHSVSINISYRITLEFVLKNDEIVLINVGDHDQIF